MKNNVKQPGKTELVTIPREEYETLVEALQLLSDKSLLSELSEREKTILNGKYFSLKDL